MKYKQVITMFLAVALVFGVFSIYIKENNISFGSAVKYLLNKQDRAMAEDIANMTGESAANIMQLKAETGNWNTAMDRLKKGDYAKIMTDDELADLILKEGYKEESVKESKEFIGQVMGNLSEILDNNSSLENSAPNIQQPKAQADIKKEEDDIEAYKVLGQAFDKNLAIYYSLRLKERFGSIQSVVDEYLYCIQVELDTRILLADEEEYEEAIMQKLAQLSREDAITVQKIFDFMLKTLNKANLQKNENKTDLEQRKPDSEKEPSVQKPDIETATDIQPKIDDPKPKDPAINIMEEVEQINSRWRN